MNTLLVFPISFVLDQTLSYLQPGRFLTPRERRCRVADHHRMRLRGQLHPRWPKDYMLRGWRLDWGARRTRVEELATRMTGGNLSFYITLI